MKRDRFLQFVRSIFGTEEHEILCSEFFELLPEYVDQELDTGGRSAPAPGDRPALKFLQVTHHIAQCPECAEAYQALLKVARSAQ